MIRPGMILETPDRMEACFVRELRRCSLAPGLEVSLVTLAARQHSGKSWVRMDGGASIIRVSNLRGWRPLVLKERQVDFLRALAKGCADRIIGGRYGALAAGRVASIAYPDRPYRQRADAGATRTLDSLEVLRLVEGSYRGFGAGCGESRDWRLTHYGKAYLEALEGVLPWRVRFMGGSSVTLKARTLAEARQGPWNPSFGSLVMVERLDDPLVTGGVWAA